MLSADSTVRIDALDKEGLDSIGYLDEPLNGVIEMFRVATYIVPSAFLHCKSTTTDSVSAMALSHP